MTTHLGRRLRTLVLLALAVGALAALSGCAARTGGVRPRAPIAGEQIGRLRAFRIPTTAVAPGVGLDEPPAAPAMPDSLLAVIAARIDSILADPFLDGADVGLLAESVWTGQIVYERNADAPLVPASNMKIVTGATVLSIFGAAHVFETDLATDGALVGSALEGNLYVRGRGDPSLTTEEVWKLVEEIETLGIGRIAGDVVLDASYFDSVSAASDEAADGDRAYQARLGALAVNFGSIAVHVRPGDQVGDPARVTLAPATGYVDVVNRARTGSSRRESTIEVARSLRHGRNTITVTGKIPAGSSGDVWNRNVENPTRYFGALFVECLSKAGVGVDGRLTCGMTPGGATVLAVHRSKPLAVILRDLNKHSNNFVAEELLKAISAHTLGPPGTTAGGASLAAGFLRSVGADSSAFRVADGSGLSRDNRLTPRAILSVVRRMLGDYGAAPEFVASLSVGGIDGTLGRRMDENDLRGAVRAKTGLLDGVTAISGILHTRSRGDFLFSMIVNGFDGEPKEVHELEERVLTALGGP
jgi:D-alanyl-D-alanine carboxypeptidase/D-alanyl-D-alanine-endopeptidase (penicillin-binding protein 4)